MNKLSRKDKVLNYFTEKKVVTWHKLLCSKCVVCGNLELQHILQLLIDSRDIIIIKGDWYDKKNLTFQLIENKR